MTPRSEAKALGMTRYISGKPCPKGHNGERMVSNGVCVACLAMRKEAHRGVNGEAHKIYMREWHARNKEAELAYRKKNKERISRYAEDWYKKNREKSAAAAKRWRSANLERSNESRRRWRRDNKERSAFLAKRWREKNPEKQRTIMFNRNSISRGVRQSVAHGVISSIKARQGFLCVYCCTSVVTVFDVDHINPVSRGGGNEVSNLQILCPSCNRSKGRKTHEEFLRWRIDNAAS